MSAAKYYAILGMPGYWGSLTRYQRSIIARVDGAKNKEAAIAAFRDTSEGRREYEEEFAAFAPSELSSKEREWIEDCCQEIIKA